MASSASAAAAGRIPSSTVAPRFATVMTFTLPRSHSPVLSSLTHSKHLRSRHVTAVRRLRSTPSRVPDGFAHWPRVRARARHSNHVFKTRAAISHDGSSDQITMASGKKLAEEKFTKLLATLMGMAAAAFFAAASVNVEAADAAEKLSGDLFQRNCAACHSGGGNILQPGASLFKKDLEKNGLATEDDIYKITYFGKSRMPGFGEKCAPRGQCTFGPRLSEEDIRALAEFVKLNADQAWPKR